MTITTAPPALELALEQFLRWLQARNRSALTQSAYRTDVGQFITWVHENNATVTTVDQVGRVDVREYLASLGEKKLSGVSRARKLAALREYFRFAREDLQVISHSPAEGLDTPKKEKNSRTILAPDEYTRMLAQAGGNPRDFAILQVFLQTGVRVSELCGLRLEAVDLEHQMITVVGKGMVTRQIELEKKGIQATKSWLNVRPDVADDHLFLNQYREPLGPRGVQKLVTKHRRGAEITKRAGCHSFRHTFATYKAQRGVSAFQLRDWLGHARLDTTQIYVHLARTNAKKEMEATSL